MCVVKINAFRRLELGAGLAAVHAQGFSMAFGAVTVRHHAGIPLAESLRILLAGMKAIPQDKGVRTLRKELGFVGPIYATEVTLGGAGWHPHRHSALIFDRPVSAAGIARLHKAQFRAYEAGVKKAGGGRPSTRGQVLRPVEWTGDAALGSLGDYFAKMEPGKRSTAGRLSWEFTGGHLKRAKGEQSASAWDLLAWAGEGDADALNLWNEYELATKGRSALKWGAGLRDRLGLGAETDDETLAAEEVGDDDDTRFWVKSWKPLAMNPTWGAELLNVVKVDGWRAGLTWCGERGIDTQLA